MPLPTIVSRILCRLAAVVPGGYTLRPWLHRIRGVRIGENVWISQNVYLDELHPEAISIGDNCTIGFRTSIFSHFYWGPKRLESNGRVVIESDVFIGPHCVILPHVVVGKGAVIKAGTVVSRAIPPKTICGTRAPEFLGVATIPLTSMHTYSEFIRGVRPPPRQKISRKESKVSPDKHPVSE